MKYYEGIHESGLSYEKALELFSTRPHTYITRPSEWHGVHFIDKDCNYCILCKDGKIITNPSEVYDTDKNDWALVYLNEEAMDIIEDIIPEQELRNEDKCVDHRIYLHKYLHKENTILTMDDLKDCFSCAIVSNSLFVAVAVSINGSEPEIIINTESNFQSKLEYYKKTYKYDLSMKFNKFIKIVGCEYGDCVEDIVSVLTV